MSDREVAMLRAEIAALRVDIAALQTTTNLLVEQTKAL
jgi:hypothetical protein